MFLKVVKFEILFTIILMNLSIKNRLIINAQNINNFTATSPIINKSVSEIYRPECSTSCEKCGVNAKCIVECGLGLNECVFNKTECSIKCECKTGNHGNFCNHASTTEIINNSTTNLMTTTTQKLFTESLDNRTPDEIFYFLKNFAWSQIMEDLNNLESNEQDNQLIENMINKVRELISELLLNEKLEPTDVYYFAKILTGITKKNPNKLYLKDDIIENILKSFDDILNLNYILYLKDNSSKSILEIANKNHNKSGMVIFDCIDELKKYSNFIHSKSKYFNSRNFKMIITGYLSVLDPEFPFRIESDSSGDVHLSESISLNENILKKKYKNNSIKVSFRIYFNKNLNTYNINETDRKRKEFYKGIEKPKNFFYDLTMEQNETDENDNELFQKNQNIILVSSNVLSASIYDPRKSKDLDDIPNENDEDYSKFVRIQFLVKLNYLSDKLKMNENFLKCVFWNKTLNKWSTNGCKSSPLESYFIQSTGYYRKVCYCNHLTNFALFFDPDNSMNPSSYSNILSILSYVGISISLTCYLTMIISRLGCYRVNPTNISSNKTLRYLYLINTLCLFISNICFVLILILKPNISFLLCKLNASILQFFLIFSFCFSFGIAYQHFSKLVKVFNNYEHFFMFKLFLFSFFYSSFFTGCTFILEYNRDYTFIEICWIKAPNIYYFFVGPINFLLFISLVLYIVVVIKVLSIYSKDDSNRTETENNSSPYNQRRVIVLLFFSFISLNLSWIIGIFILIASYIDQNLKFFLELIFCLLNSFHGLSLLVGQYLAHKYSKSGSYSSSSFTKTILNNNREKLLVKTVTNSSSSGSSSKLDNKLSYENQPKTPKKAQTYIFLSGIIYAFTALGKCCVKKNKKNTSHKLNIERLYNNTSSFKRAPFLEFNLMNHEMESDSNQNFQTVHTNLPSFEINIFNNSKIPNKDTLMNYYDINHHNDNQSSLFNNMGQDAYSSSV